MLRDKMSAAGQNTKPTLNERQLWLPTPAEFVEETCKDGCQTDHYQQHQNMRGLLLYECANGTKIKRNMFLCEVALGEPQVVRNTLLFNNRFCKIIIVIYIYILNT